MQSPEGWGDSPIPSLKEAALVPGGSGQARIGQGPLSGGDSVLSELEEIHMSMEAP